MFFELVINRFEKKLKFGTFDKKLNNMVICNVIFCKPFSDGRTDFS